MADRYKVLHPIRRDGELVTSGTIELPEEEAKIALERGVVQTLSEALGGDTPEDDESTGTANLDNPDSDKDLTDENPSDLDPEMVRLFGEDLAGDLYRGGYESVEQVRGAGEEELLAVNGVGRKRLEQIRRASDNAIATS